MQFMNSSIYLGDIYWVPLHAGTFFSRLGLQWLVKYRYTLKTLMRSEFKDIFII